MACQFLIAANPFKKVFWIDSHIVILRDLEVPTLRGPRAGRIHNIRTEQEPSEEDPDPLVRAMVNLDTLTSTLR